MPGASGETSGCSSQTRSWLVLGQSVDVRSAAVRGQRGVGSEEEGNRMPRTKKHVSSHTPSLQRFALEDLAPFTKEGMFSKSASRDFHLFYVGRDDVHGILKGPAPWRRAHRRVISVA